MTRSRDLLRQRERHDHGKVSFVELFFDLVFVFAVTQLSHSLIEHFTLVGAAHTLLLMLAVWWVWIYTTWVTNSLDPERLPVRLVLLTLMLVGLILSSSIPKAFESRGLAFGAYVAMQVGRTLFFLWAVKGHPGMVRNFQRILIWLVLAGVFWIAGGIAHHAARFGLWVLALSLEYVSPSLGFRVPGLGRSTTGDWNVEGGHMAERCGLFVIIALGESILVTGATFSGLPWTPASSVSWPRWCRMPGSGSSPRTPTCSPQAAGTCAWSGRSTASSGPGSRSILRPRARAAFSGRSWQPSPAS
jgi:low temperature requirement protein LtrA